MQLEFMMTMTSYRMRGCCHLIKKKIVCMDVCISLENDKIVSTL